MTSKSAVKTMCICSPSELQAFSKLVQMVANSTQHEQITMEAWTAYCMSAFGWTHADTTFILKKTRQLANRVLEDAKLVV